MLHQVRNVTRKPSLLQERGERNCFYSLTHSCPTLAQNRSTFNLIIVAPYCQFHLQPAKYTVLIQLSPDYTLDLH